MYSPDPVDGVWLILLCDECDAMVSMPFEGESDDSIVLTHQSLDEHRIEFDSPDETHS
jgi:hypothetical protein